MIFMIAQNVNIAEGVNVPGDYNGWANVPSNLAFANPNQASGGRFVRITTGAPRYQTIFSVASSGGDIVGGSYPFKFSSGPTSNYWFNSWGGTSFTTNSLQTTFIGSGSNNTMSFTNGMWYTLNYMDNNYSNTEAIFMATSAQPVTLNSASQLPSNGNVGDTDDVIVTVNASASPSAEEIVYVRWSNDAFATSNLALVTFAGNIGTATIPAQAAATQVDYYAFSTTINSPNVADADKVTIRFLNAGSGNFSYTVNTPLPPVTITFQVDMSQQTVPGAVNIAGTFTGWNSVAMTDAGGGLYTYDAVVNQNSVHQYKFINGSSYEPNLGSPCGVSGNRGYTVGNASITESAVCFGSCSSCPPVNNVTFRVNTTNETVAGYMYINGSFPPANWTTPQLMTNAGGGVYTYQVSLPQEASYEYKFINGSTYENNLSSPCGNGNNRTINVPSSSSTLLPLTCFSFCNDCIVMRQTTFNVNMANVNVSSNGVHLAGNFLSAGYDDWNPSFISMSDANGDGVYSVTLNLAPGATYNYKFLNGNAWGTDESVPGGCNFSGNREVTVPNANSSIPAVCFSSCSNCTFAVSNDSPYTATNVSYSSNGAYPNCYAINGSVANATNSDQSITFSGNDTWYKFVAQSSAVSITLTSAGMDDVIELYSKVGSGFTLIPGGVENASGGVTDFERLNYSGLTPNQTYYISVGAVNSSASSAFTLCIQHLMPSGCAYSIPVSGFPLCNSYKAIYRGSPGQGVTYGFNFTGIGGGASGTTSVDGTNGLISLSNSLLALRYGGIYDVSVDVTYGLYNSASALEEITILGSSAANNCSGVNIISQPLMEVKSSQRCPGTLLRSNYLIGTPATGSTNACGAINYTYEFTQITSCDDNTPVSAFPVEYTTNGNTPYLQLGVLSNLPNSGAWRVSIRPNFSYGQGVYGAAYNINVNNTASGIMLTDEELANNEEKSFTDESHSALYPNPSNGDYVNINITDIQSDAVFVRVLDGMGRMVYQNRFTVNGSLNTMINFSEPLSSGIYMVEMTIDNEVKTERMLIER